MNNVHRVIRFVLIALPILFTPQTRAGGDGCTSTIISHEDHSCWYSSVHCDYYFCNTPGPCNYCSDAVLTFALCDEQEESLCLELFDCDGCGVRILGNCQRVDGAWICVQSGVGDDCFRTWCTNSPGGEG